MISGEGGLFPILEFDVNDGWDQLLQLAGPDLDRKGMNRLMSVLDRKCLCVVIERHYIDKDFRDTFGHFHSKRFNTPSSRCVRLHFFATSVTEETIADGRPPVVEAYLGYSVVRPTKPNCIGRTLISHRLRLRSEAHVSLCMEEVSLLGTRFEVSGFPFISQDTDATVCAESALWMILRYYSNRYTWYPEILPFQITNLAASHAAGSRVYPSSGLYAWQLAEALRIQRFSPVVYSKKQVAKEFDGNDDRFEHLLYTYIESGIPLLLTFPDHVVAVYGHLSEYEADPPDNPVKFLYSSHFNRAFVISDDNFFPYQTLHKSGAGKVSDSQLSWRDVQEFIVPLPERVFLTAGQVQKAIETVLSDVDVGIAKCSPSMSCECTVLRLFLTTAQSFKRLLRERGMGNEVVERAYRTMPMPHFIWVCEISTYDDYSRHRMVFGEVLWDATRNAHEPDGWIALHYPERLILDVGSALNGPQSLVQLPLTGSKSYCLFKSNLHSL